MLTTTSIMLSALDVLRYLRLVAHTRLARLATALLMALVAASTTVDYVAAQSLPTQISSNWAGYAATEGRYTEVSGTWTIPTYSAMSSAGVSATWVGIGGVNSRDLIQAGTQQQTTGTGQTHGKHLRERFAGRRGLIISTGHFHLHGVG